MGFRASLEQTKELLFGCFLGLSRSLDTLHVVHVRGLVIASELGSGSWDGFGRSLASFAAGPVQTFSIAKDGNALFLLETSTGVFLVTSRPLLLPGSLDVGVVPALDDVA